MNTERIIDLINNDETLSRFQKNILNGFISRSEVRQNEYNEDRKLVEEIANEKRSFEVLLSNEDVKIYKVDSNGDEWDTKYPYKSIYFNSKGQWERTSVASPTFDTAFLSYLSVKNLGLNSDFVEFTCKILNIDLKQYD